MRTTSLYLCCLAAGLCCWPAVAWADTPLGRVFSYQAQLKDSGQPVDQSADFEISLWDAETDGFQVGLTAVRNAVEVKDGLFVIDDLDFGEGAFAGKNRWIQVSARVPAVTGNWQTLARQPLLPAPYALYARRAAPTNWLEAADGDPTEALYVDADGNVGIGLDDPTALLHMNDYQDTNGDLLLHVRGALESGTMDALRAWDGGRVQIGDNDPLNFTGNGSLVVGHYLGISPGGSTLVIGQSGTDYGPLLVIGNDSDINSKISVFWDGQGGYGEIWAGSTLLGGERDLVLQNHHVDANVGIGTDNPIAKLDVRGEVFILAPVSGTLGDPGGTLYAWNGDSTNPVNAAVLGRRALYSQLATTLVQPRSGVWGDAYQIDEVGVLGTCDGGDGVQGVTDTGRAVRGSVRDAGGGGTGYAGYFEDGRVFMSGPVGIADAGPSYPLDVNGDIRCVNLHETSDGRFKENIAPVTDALDMIEHLRGVQFDWNREEYPDHEFSDRRQVGFIAQEINQVLPEVVAQGSDGFYSVDYGRVVPVLTEALKELHTEVQAKNAQIASLTARIERLETLLASTIEAETGGAR